MPRFASLVCAVVALGVSASVQGGTVIVTSPEGTFTNAGPNNATGPGAGFDTWYANNVRNGGSVGITSTYPDAGNGSIEFSGPANAKADFEYYFSPNNTFLLSSLTAFSYDKYRSSTSTAGVQYEPALRLAVSDGTYSGYLVYEGIYNGQPVAPLNTFTTANVLPAFVWGTGNLPGNFSVYNRTIADWVALLPNLKVYGLSTGIGSGWNGSFAGAVDNITYGVNGGDPTTFNFEVPAVATPEPTTLALAASGLVVLGVRQFRRRARVGTPAR